MTGCVEHPRKAARFLAEKASYPLCRISWKAPSIMSSLVVVGFFGMNVLRYIITTVIIFHFLIICQYKKDNQADVLRSRSIAPYIETIQQKVVLRERLKLDLGGSKKSEENS